MKSRRPQSYRPIVERLEDRITPSSGIWGVPWPNPGHLTLSFVPDKTQAGLGTSNLFQTLNAVAPQATWELAIVRAFQTWAVNANINIGVVNDDGSSLGTPGAVQGDSRFGDIRIAATAPGQSHTTDLANSQPFSWTGTTWSGDVVLNTSYPITMGNQPGKYDLYSIMLHEAGHVLGLDCNNNPASVMYQSYHYQTQLDSADITALQALYGTRTISDSNNTFGSATSLSMASAGTSGAGNISSSHDLDYYKIKTPGGLLSGFTGFTVQVNTAGLSLLTSTLYVYNSSGQQVASTATVDPLSGILSLDVNARQSSTYYVRVGSSTSDVFGVGTYQVNIANHYSLISLTTVTNLLSGAVGGLLGLTFGTADHLLSQNSGNSQVADYFTTGNLTTGNGAHYYVVQSPANASGNPENMVAMLWALDVNGLQGRIHVFDANQNPVPVEILANDGINYTIQLPSVAANASYYIQVAPANSSSFNTGRYALVADFHQPLVSFDNTTAGELTDAQPQTSGTFTANREGLFYFALSASSANVNAWGTMTIVDSNGTTVATVQVEAGQPTVTAEIYLKMGTYSLIFSGSTSDGSALGSIDFNLAGDALSDPVGAYPTSPSSPPSSAPPPASTYNPGSPSTAQAPPSSPPHYY
jgi:hypothetical protein